VHITRKVFSNPVFSNPSRDYPRMRSGHAAASRSALLASAQSWGIMQATAELPPLSSAPRHHCPRCGARFTLFVPDHIHAMDGRLGGGQKLIVLIASSDGGGIPDSEEGDAT